MQPFFKTEFPIMQTPMRDHVATDLVVAVSEAGGVGTLDATDLSPKQIRHSIEIIRSQTSQPFCVHVTVPQPFETTVEQVDIVKQAIRPFFLKHGLDEPELCEPYAENFTEQMNTIVAAEVSLFQFSGGIPVLSWITTLKQQGVRVLGTATHIEEAIILQKVGVDAIVAQALEAYGERVTFIGETHQAMVMREKLLSEWREQITIPLFINGGIATQEAVSRAFELGADGVQIATPLLLCAEAGLAESIQQQLATGDAVFSNAVTGRLARVLRGALIDDLLQYKPFMLPYPLQYNLMRPLLACEPVHYLEALDATPEAKSVAELLQQLCVEVAIPA